MQAAVIPARRAGFTLVEMVVTMAILGILATVVGAVLMPAFQSQQGLERRAALVEAADGAIRRMTRDIRISVPNSVRVTNTLATGSGFALELIPSADGGRYCTSGTADCDATGALDIGAADTVFDILGCYRNAAFIAASGTNAYRLIVGSTDSAIYTAAGASAVIAPVGAVTLSTSHGGACGTASGVPTTFNRHRVTIAAHTFPTASPRQRVFIVEQAVAPATYICNFTAGTLTRYAGYAGATLSSASQPTNPGAAPLSGVTGRLLADKVTACSIASTEANVQTSGVVTLSLTLSDSGETVTLTNQVQLDNSQ